MSKLWAKIRHNQGLAVSGVLALAVVAWAYGCESTVRSIVHPEQRLNRTTFQSEVDTFLALAQSKFDSLDQQDELKQKVFGLAIEYAKGGKLNPAAVALTLGNILGLGMYVDNRRKDVHIKTLKGNTVNKDA